MQNEQRIQNLTERYNNLVQLARESWTEAGKAHLMNKAADTLTQIKKLKSAK